MQRDSVADLLCPKAQRCGGESRPAATGQPWWFGLPEVWEAGASVYSTRAYLVLALYRHVGSPALRQLTGKWGKSDHKQVSSHQKHKDNVVGQTTEEGEREAMGKKGGEKQGP